MKFILNWFRALLRCAALLVCCALTLGLAPQPQAGPTIPGYIVTPFASVPHARGVTFDTTGNLLTLEPDAGIVYSIDSAGQKHVLTDLPDFTPGYIGPAFDPVSGNVFVSRYMNQSGNQVLRITPDGNATVFASGIPAPTSLTTDAEGNLYVASYACPASVYKVTPDGVVSEFATDLCRADGPAFDKNGDLLICNRGTNQIMRVPPGGGVATVYASGFDIPAGLAFDEQGDLLVANSNNGTISRVDSQRVSHLFGTGFTNPVSLAFDQAGRLFIADLGAGQIYKATPIEPVPPIANQLTINGGALVTTSANVRLDVSAANVDESQGDLSMSFSNDGESWSTWQPYTASSSWQLTSGNGMKTVYGRFKNSTGAISDIVSDTIALDTSVQSEYGMTINNGALYTNRTEVQLTISAKPSTAEMQVSNDGGFNGVAWEPFTSHKSWQITRYRNQEITRLAYVRFRDVDGNVSSMYLDDIILDLNPPGGHAQIANTGQGTQLSLAATDDVSGVEGMRLSARADFDGASWEPFAANRTWDFSASSTVYVQFRDRAGNVSPAYTASLSEKHVVLLPLVLR